MPASRGCAQRASAKRYYLSRERHCALSSDTAAPVRRPDRGAGVSTGTREAVALFTPLRSPEIARPADRRAQANEPQPQPATAGSIVGAVFRIQGGIRASGGVDVMRPAQEEEGHQTLVDPLGHRVIDPKEADRNDRTRVPEGRVGVPEQVGPDEGSQGRSQQHEASRRLDLGEGEQGPDEPARHETVRIDPGPVEPLQLFRLPVSGPPTEGLRMPAPRGPPSTPRRSSGRSVGRRPSCRRLRHRPSAPRCSC